MGLEDRKKAQLQANIARPGTNNARIGASPAEIEASTATDWGNVKGEAPQTADDTKTWWERQKEMVDQKTDADKDKDGH